jgi:hypothetical protein
MKQGSNSRRPRGRSNNKRSPGRNNNHDNGGSDVRLRGNASQVYEKYLALARDALSSDDSISSENYSQHAEHFYRIMSINTENQKNTNNSSQNKGHNSDKDGEQTNSQKERSKGRNSRNNNRGNNQNIDPIVEKNEDNNKQNQEIEGSAPVENKRIKKIEIKTPSEDLTENANNKEDVSQKSGSA